MAYTTIDNPELFFQTKLHSGDGGGGGSLTFDGSENMQPDMIWSKSRTEALNHTLFDSVRTAASNKELSPNGNYSEGGADSNGFGYISAFNSNGFTWTAGGTNTENFNKSSQTYVHWCWKANGAGSANTDGDINSTVSANTDAGFSIVKYTGNGSTNQTVGHGLGVAPAFIMYKGLENVHNWLAYHKSLGATKGIFPNLTNAQETDSAYFDDTEPTSSVFSVTTTGNGDQNNISGEDYIAYCFAEKQGYSKFGSYQGNSSNNGPFCYTGFKPAFLLWKSTGSENWYINDNKREPYNDDAMSILYPNLTNTEGALSDEIDLLSNGFKIRGTNSAHNTNGQEYIYMCFAEAPLVGSNNVPCTAR